MAKVSDMLKMPSAEKIISSTGLLAYQRLITTLGIPIGLALGGFALNWVVDTTKENTTAIRKMEKENAVDRAEMKATVAAMTNNVIPNVLSLLNGRVDVHAGRLDKLETKVDANMKEVRDLDASMKERFQELMKTMYERSNPVPYNRSDPRQAPR